MGVALIGAGLITVGIAVVDPQTVERTYGDIKITVARSLAGDAIPTVTLGQSGAETLLDRCDGTFSEMVDGHRDDVPPLWAAHNYCGGDIVLSWEIGQLVNVEVDGIIRQYRVAGTRDTAKYGVTSDALVGIPGDVLLQTCYYGRPQMHFVGLSIVDDAE
ncbi:MULTISPECIES: hypothetical protein [unclassified Plantibacter]|uniref:hypothetical protein n=1 Tax=unclassified Plantibacter TaxID=2624265 RepID=UPI0017855D88|nr:MULTISPECIES: hypothetical protein [unclassified Plantibacter]MBD8519129.1 hypothetical protein [Plantibacter sp. CFBP 8804]MBD8535594.1 hypothetical protein [Plantibacter sp. CFBP 13570]